MEKNFKLTIRYDGTNYHGFQIQPEVRTIQGELEKALSILFQSEVKIYGAGRTDAGVHASGQVVNFRHITSKEKEHIYKALNGLLPKDIAVKSIEEVPPDFHARFSAKSRAYQYIILNRSFPDVFFQKYVHFYRYPLDVEAMNQACKLFEGNHDFTSFRVASEEEEDNRRTIYRFNCHRYNDFIISEVEANGFLHMMVRILMGTILMAGRGKYSQEKILEILDAKNRIKAGPTLPAKGLCLIKVTY